MNEDCREYHFTFAIDIKYSEETLKGNLFIYAVTKFDIIKN